MKIEIKQRKKIVISVLNVRLCCAYTVPVNDISVQERLKIVSKNV